MKILVIGETNLDVILSGSGELPVFGREILVNNGALVLGSSGFITGMGLRKLGNAVSVFTKAGCDPAGDLCFQALSAGGVDISSAVRDPGLRTGITVSLSAPRDRALVSFLGATECLAESDVPDEVFAGCNHLHVSSYFIQTGLRPGMQKLFQRARAAGLTVSLDPACDPAGIWGPELREVLLDVDVFLPNDSELRGITGQSDPENALRQLQNGHTVTVAKLGSRGTMTLENGRAVTQSAPQVPTVDATGAGDSFNAGFLHAWLHRLPLAAALRLAVACGSFSMQGFGGTAAQPTIDQARNMLREYSLSISTGELP